VTPKGHRLRIPRSLLTLSGLLQRSAVLVLASALLGASGKTVLPCRTLKCVRGPAAALSVRSKKRTASKFGPDARESLHQDLDAKRGDRRQSFGTACAGTQTVP